LEYQRLRRFEKLDSERPGRRQWSRRFVRHDYFEELRLPRQAYVLGLLAADGNVFGSRISIELAEKDRALSALVRDELAPRISFRSRRRQAREYVVFAVASARLAATLASFGVTPRKSATLRWPEALPASLARPFLLGYFDGDGFVTWSRTGRWAYARWGLIGTEPFLESVSALLEREARVRPRRLREANGCWRLHITGRDAFAVDTWLHEGPESGLARKRLQRSRV
jgi:LAGLIDADG-like domain